MKNKIYVDYWTDNKGEIKNFGDELNKYLIEKLTGKEIERVNFKFLFNDFFKALKILSYYLIKGNITLLEYYNHLKIHKNKPSILLFIGSILSHCRTPNYVVWGAGIMFKNDKFSNADFRAVRGEYSQKRISDLGYKAPEVLGDPAILLPLVYKPSNPIKKYKLGIVPHFRHYKEIKENFNDNNILIIDLNSPIETVINHIISCEKTISTSLHGIIVSHAYQIPSLWVKFREVNHDIGGDDIKFADYFSSVLLPEYNPCVVESINQFDLDTFLENWSYNFSNIDLAKKNHLEKMQKDLLKVSPINLKKEYN